MQFKRSVKRDNPENIVPLINIVFLLLIFFMLTAKLTPQDPFEINTPKSVASLSEEKKIDGILYLSKSAELVYQQKKLSQPELLSQLSTKHFGASGLPLKIKADSQAPVSSLVRIMGYLKKSGIKEIKLITIKASHGE